MFSILFNFINFCLLFTLAFLFIITVNLNFLFIIIQMPHYPDEIEYSDKYLDDYYEYRHVMLPREISKKVPKGKLLNEAVILE